LFVLGAAAVAVGCGDKPGPSPAKLQSALQPEVFQTIDEAAEFENDALITSVDACRGLSVTSEDLGQLGSDTFACRVTFETGISGARDIFRFKFNTDNACFEGESSFLDSELWGLARTAGLIRPSEVDGCADVDELKEDASP
jgi:hypothetical protein